MRLQPKLEQGGLQRRKHGKIAAARTPVGMDFALVAVFDELGGRLDFGRGGWRWSFDGCTHNVKLYTKISCAGTERLVLPASCSFTALTMWCGMNGSPSYLRIWPCAVKPVSERRRSE